MFYDDERRALLDILAGLALITSTVGSALLLCKALGLWGAR